MTILNLIHIILAIIGIAIIRVIYKNSENRTKEEMIFYENEDEFQSKEYCLYLRSFQEDGIVPSSGVSWINPFGFKMQSREMTICKEINKVMPIIKISNPKEREVRPGANAIALTNDEWKDKVKSYMSTAQIIVVQPGISEWVEWEIDEIVENNYLYKTIFFASFSEADYVNYRKMLKKLFFKFLREKHKIYTPDNSLKPWFVIDKKKVIYKWSIKPFIKSVQSENQILN